jgi:protein-disulfide isomerase
MAHPVVKELQRLLGDKVRFVFRHFPLAAVHPQAEMAAEAAEAAGAQGKFWQMHDMLFENQRSLDAENLVTFAAVVGLSVPRFVREMNEHKYLPRVREDFLSGARSGVNGTPTFFINGVRHDGPWDLASLLVAIKRAADATRAAKSGQAARAVHR